MSELLAKLVRNFSRPPTVDWVRTGIHALDLTLGDGIPLGRVVEISGPESGGKSLLAWEIAKAFQKAEGVALLYDVEATAPKKFMDRVGVDPERLILRRQKHNAKKGEEHLDTIQAIEDDIIRMLPIIRKACKGPIVVIWDSIAATSSEDEWQQDRKTGERVVTEKGYMANRARALSQAMRRLTSPLATHGATLLAINQLRDKVGVVFGSRTYTPGGWAMKFHSSVRLELSRRGKVMVEDKYIGVDCHLRIQKSKLTEPFREADLRIYWEVGFDPLFGIGETLVKAGRLKDGKKPGSFLYKGAVYRRKNLGMLLEKRPALLEAWL